MPKLESFFQTPDGPGNVKSIDLLRETVKVSLDSAPEGLKLYRNCEIRVLRNGKGSRDGIDVGEPTERYVEEKEDELIVPPIIASPYFVDAALEEAPVREKMSEESEGGKPRHRGNRRGRKGGRSGAEERSGVVTEKRPEKKKKDKSAAEKVEKTVEKVEKTAEKRPDRRKEKKPADKKPPKAPEAAVTAPEKKRGPRPPKKAEGAPAPEKAPKAAEGGENKPRRRPHHRGGRRKKPGEGGANPAPKSE